MMNMFSILSLSFLRLEFWHCLEVGNRALCKEYSQNPWTAASSTWYTYSADDLRVRDMLWPFFPNCKQIKQSWLTETKNTGLFSLLRVFDKSSPQPSHFIHLQIVLPKGVCTAHPKPGALQRHQLQYLLIWATFLINQKRGMEANQRVPLLSDSCLSELKVVLKERHSEMHEDSAGKTLWKGKRRNEAEATAESNRLLSEANSVPLLNKVSVIYLLGKRSFTVLVFL